MAANLFERYCESTTVHGFKYLIGKQSFAQRVFWAVIIALSIFCTSRLIASLINQISRNPIVIYRDDTPIDVTKIPFPAFTMNGYDRNNDTDAFVHWQDEFLMPQIEAWTELGLCRVANFCDRKNYLRDEVGGSRIFGKYYNSTYMYTDARGYIEPFQLTIHSPFELPTRDEQQFQMEHMDYDTFWVTPQLNRIDDSMIAMEPRERSCFLPNEKTLTLYKVYNEANCKAECKSNFIVAECGCVPEYTIANASIPLCKTRICADQAETKFKDEMSETCTCWPSCEHLTYLVERTKGDFTNENPYSKKQGVSSLIFKVKFKPGDHFSIVRRKHFTVTEIFAFIGGLLGLFLGISVVTFAELINVLLQPLLKKNCNENKVKSYFSFYLKESSIHSFNFIANASNCFECMFWVCSFILSMTGCIFMVAQLRQTMDFKAVTVVIEDQLVDVSEIPFPAVTIFGSFPNVVKLWYPELQSLDEYAKNPVYSTLPSFNLSRHASSKFPTSRVAAISFLGNGFYDYPFEKYLNYTDHEKHIVGEMKELSKADWFRQQKGSFGKYFSAPFAEILTYRGMAFTFNVIDFDDLLKRQTISDDFYYERNYVLNDHLKTRKEKFPWHASASESLDLEINVNPDPVVAYTETFSVHPTDELPMMLQAEDIFGFGGGRHLEAFITPSVIRSDENLRTIDPTDRLCYFEGERKLRFFKVYTKHNCEIECFAKYLPKACNCSFYDIVHDSNTRVCSTLNWSDYKCYYDVGREFRDLKTTEKLTSCSCLPTCDAVSYNIAVRESKLRGNEFGDEYFRPMRRKLRYTIIDFLSYVGGLLGLFAGISVLSFFELFYFYVLRILSNIFVKKEAERQSVLIVRPAK